MKRVGSFVVIVSLGLGLAGCGDKKPAATPDDVDVAAKANATEPKPEKPAEKDESSEKVDASRDSDKNAATATVDESVAKMCDLPDARFGFDSSALGNEARRVVDAIAKCFTSGPGKGRGLHIVGHADPRGEEEYNLALGQRRAGAVAGLLKGAGLDEDRVMTTSRGELDATGQDEAGWSRDRRVEIQLAQ